MSIWHGSRFPALLFRAFNRLAPDRLGVQAMRLQPRRLTSACIAEIGEQIDCITLKEIADFLAGTVRVNVGLQDSLILAPGP